MYPIARPEETAGVDKQIKRCLACTLGRAGLADQADDGGRVGEAIRRGCGAEVELGPDLENAPQCRPARLTYTAPFCRFRRTPWRRRRCIPPLDQEAGSSAIRTTQRHRGRTRQNCCARWAAIQGLGKVMVDVMPVM